MYRALLLVPMISILKNPCHGHVIVLTYDFVEEPNALDPLVDVLGVEVNEFRDAGKHDPDLVPGL